MNISGRFKKIKSVFDKLKLDEEPESAEKLIQFDKIASAVKSQIEKNMDKLGERVLVPNVINIYMSKQDRRKRLDRENILIEELEKGLLSFIMENEKEFQKEFMDIQILTDDKLNEGDFYVEVSINRMDGEKEPEVISEKARLEEEVREGNLIIEITHGLKKEEYIPDKNEIIIGRSEEADIVLEDPKKLISRYHCTIYIDGKNMNIVSTGANGTFLKKEETVELERLPDGKKYEIKTGDTLKIEDYYLKLKST